MGHLRVAVVVFVEGRLHVLVGVAVAVVVDAVEPGRVRVDAGVGVVAVVAAKLDADRAVAVRVTAR